MFVLGNQVLNVDQAFTGLDGTQYPMNWLRLTTLEEKQAIGIQEVPDPVRPDDRFYFVDGNGIGTPRDLAALKAEWSVKVNDIAYSMLATTDWYVVRKAEGGADIPADVATFRAAVRSAANANQTALNNAADFDTFMQVATALTWPEVTK
jgi:hypothetical protein